MGDDCVQGCVGGVLQTWTTWPQRPSMWISPWLCENAPQACPSKKNFRTTPGCRHEATQRGNRLPDPPTACSIAALERKARCDFRKFVEFVEFVAALDAARRQDGSFISPVPMSPSNEGRSCGPGIAHLKRRKFSARCSPKAEAGSASA